jgi:hypothetical protein
MEDDELGLLVGLAFLRGDMGRFVFEVVDTITDQFRSPTWPDTELQLGRQMIGLGQALEQHASRRSRSSTSDGPNP